MVDKKAKDPYHKTFKSIEKILVRLSDMIVFVAKRSMSVKEFEEFLHEFSEKDDK